MAKSDDQDPLVDHIYNRTQFRKDAIWMGLDGESTVTRTALRLRRNQLLSQHHPDHGGSAEMAMEINAVYGRMLLWLNRRHLRREGIRTRRENFQKHQEEPGIFQSARTAVRQVGVANLYALALAALLGYQALTKRRR